MGHAPGDSKRTGKSNRMSALSYAERRALFLAAAIRQWDVDGMIAHPYEAKKSNQREADND